MTILLPTLAVAFAAFCVWLTVRIVNDGDEAFVTLKNGPMDGVVIPRREKDCIADGLYIGPGPYYPSYRVQPDSVPLIAEFEGYLR